MRLRWPRFLPGYPAVVLMLAILGLWVVLCTIPRKDNERHRYLDYGSGPVSRGVRGFPLIFIGSKRVHRWGPSAARDYGFKPVEFLADLTVALATAYLLAMAVDRLVFPAVRAARRRKRGTGKAG